MRHTCTETIRKRHLDESVLKDWRNLIKKTRETDIFLHRHFQISSVTLVMGKLLASCRTLFNTFFLLCHLLIACEKCWIWVIYINVTLTPEISIPAFFFFRITTWVNSHQSWREQKTRLVSRYLFFNLECRIYTVKEKMFGIVVLAWFDGLNSSAKNYFCCLA